MSDFFDRVVARAHGAERTIQPLTASRYAPPAQRFAPPDALSEARAPADAVAPSLGSPRADAVASQGTPPPRDQRSTGTGRSEANQIADDGPLAPPSRRALSHEAFDEDALTPIARRTPPLAVSEVSGSRAPVQSPVVMAESIEPRRLDDGAETGPFVAAGKIEATNATDGAASEPASSLSDARGAIGAEREDGPAQRARDLLADIYYGPADAHAAAEPAASSPTLALGDWNGPGPREMTARAQPEEQGPREITIAIDRIDVRGIAPAPRPEQRGRRGPRLTLDEYMRQHGRAKR